MIIRNLILILLWATIPTIVSAKKIILPIELVATQADIIVTGEIIGFGSNTYDFKVSEFIKGGNDSILIVQQFKEWICDTRYAKVAKGQHLFLFLKWNNGELNLINGSTGEIPILDNEVTLNHEELIQIDYQSNPYKLSITDFKIGIKQFIDCFAMPTACDECFPDTLVQKCKDTQVKKFMAISEFTKWIYKKVKANYKIAKV